MAERVAVPRLLSRSTTLWLSVGVAVVGVIGVVGWALATQPVANQVAAVVVGVLLLLAVAFVTGRRTWLDTTHGLVGRDVWGVLRRTVAWRDADRVQVASNRAGQALLEVGGSGARTSIHLPLVAVDVGGDRTQDPAFLRTLAAEIDRWAPQRSAVVRSLVGQAEHLEAGGTVRDSPLARRYLASSR